MKLLFVKNTNGKGFVANHNGKFYFPDRSSQIKTEGVYECFVTIENPTYSFVNGTPIETHMPTDDYMAKNFLNNIKDNSTEFYVKKIGESTVLFKREGRYVSIGYIDQYGVYVEVVFYDNGNKKHRGIAMNYEHGRFENIEEFMAKKQNAICNMGIKLTKETVTEPVVIALCHCGAGLYSWNSVDNVAVHEDKYITVEIADKYEKNGRTRRVYICDDTYTIIDVTHLFEIENKKKTFDVDVNDVVKWMTENYVGVSGFFEDVLISHEIYFKDDTITVKYINGKRLKDVTDEMRKEAAESFKELEAYRKRMGKYVTKSTLSDFKNLSIKNALQIPW